MLKIMHRYRTENWKTIKVSKNDIINLFFPTNNFEELLFLSWLPKLDTIEIINGKYVKFIFDNVDEYFNFDNNKFINSIIQEVFDKIIMPNFRIKWSDSE